MKKSNYFSHDYSASEDPKIIILIDTLGYEAYGIYWALIEKLATNNGKLPTKLIPILVKKMGVKKDILESIINDFDLFIIEDNNFYSKRLLETITMVEMFTSKGKEGAAKRWNKNDNEKKMVL